MLSWSWSSRSNSSGYLRDYSPQWTPFFSPFPVVTQSASSRGAVVLAPSDSVKYSLTVLSYDLLPGVISMSAVAFLILVNSMLCIVAIYAALYWSSDVLGACLLLQSTGKSSQWHCVIGVFCAAWGLWHLLLIGWYGGCLAYPTIIHDRYHFLSLLFIISIFICHYCNL